MDGVILSRVDSCAVPSSRKPVWMYVVSASDNKAYFDGSTSNPGARARCGCPCTSADKGSVSIRPLLPFITANREELFYCGTGYHGDTTPTVAGGWLIADYVSASAEHACIGATPFAAEQPLSCR
jgi:hypothetical protein